MQDGQIEYCIIHTPGQLLYMGHLISYRMAVGYFYVLPANFCPRGSLLACFSVCSAETGSTAEERGREGGKEGGRGRRGEKEGGRREGGGNRI